MKMEKLCEKMEEKCLRIENIILLAGVLCHDAFPDNLRDFLDTDDWSDIEKAFGDIPEEVKNDYEDGEEYALFEWLRAERMFGYLIQMATPIHKYSDSGEHCSYSWGCYKTKWFYGADLWTAINKAFSWAAEVRQSEKEERK